MSTIRDIADVKGSVFDLPHAMALDDTDCNVLLVTSRTLFFIQSFATKEVQFTARYASEFLPGGLFTLADTGTDLDDINKLALNYDLEVIPVTTGLIEALDGIQSAILTATSNACACGTVGETLEAAAGVPGGTPPAGFGEPDPGVVDRRCKAANAIHQSIVNTIIALDDSPVEGFLSLGFGVVAGLVSAMVAAAFIPVVGILLVGVAGAVVGVTLAVLGSSLDTDGLRIDLEDFGEFLVCALVEAVSVSAARDAYLDVLFDETAPLANVALISALLTNNVLDLLYFSSGNSETFFETYVPPISCASCAEFFTHIFDFTIDEQGWVNGAAFGRDFGVYVPGVGWQGEWGIIVLKNDERLYLQRIFASREITSIEVFYTMAGPSGVESNTVINTIVTQEEIEPWACTNCSFEHLYQPDPADTTTELRTVAVADAPAEGSTDILVYKISVSGLGSDPF